MLTALLLGILQLFSISADTQTSKEIRSQAKQYITQIEAGNNTTENRWALALLGSKNEKIRAFIERNARSSSKLDSYQHFEVNFRQQIKKVAFQRESPDLLIALLLKMDGLKNKERLFKEFSNRIGFQKNQDIDYKKICQAIIHDKMISADILTTRRFQFVHFLLLYDKKFNNNFTDSYLTEIDANWNYHSATDNNLFSKLAVLSYFRVLYINSRYSKAADFYDFVIQDRLFPDSPLKLQLYRYLDYSMYRMGYYSKGLAILGHQALPLAKRYGNQQLQLNLKMNQATYLYDIGKTNKAKLLFKDILGEADSLKVNVPKTIIYNNLALAHYKSGEYDQYVNLQQKALQRAKKKKNYSHQIELYNNLYVYARKSNNKKGAKSYLEEARELAEAKNNEADLAKVYTSLGAFYRKFKRNFKLSSSYFSKAEQILNAQNNTFDYLELLNEQSESYEEQKKFEQAFQKQNQIKELVKEQNPSYLDAMVNKALLKLKMGALTDAHQIIERYKSYDLGKLGFVQLVKAKTVEADYLSRNNKHHQALDILNPVIKQVLVRAQKSANLKTGFWHVEDEFLDAFELAVKVHRSLGQPGKAVEKLDQLKTINDASLYQNPLVKSSMLNVEQLSKYKRLQKKLDTKRKNMLTTSTDQKLKIKRDITSLKIEKQKLDRKLSNETQAKPKSLKDIQSRLSARQQLLHVTELNNKYYVAHISRTKVNLETVALDSSQRKKLTSTIHQVSVNEVNLNSLYSITKLLGIDNIPSHVEKLTIIPDSYLYQLPVDILPLTQPTGPSSYGQVSYAIESFKTRYLTSLDDYFSSSNSKNNIGFAGYGVSEFNHSKEKLVPLPYTKEEVQGIKSKLTHVPDRKTFINENATKTSFEHTAPNAQILHMATHSAISERNPMFSKIYLNDDGDPRETEGNKIFAYELFELNLNNEMIMLNSCSSGSGSYIPGAGVMGMSRALQYAGANSLVLNLWSVNDMLASEFATYFYGKLNEGQSKAEALRNTKIHFLQTKNASPHFWGPYMLLGNDDAIVKPDQTTNLAVAGTFLLFFILATGLSLLVDQGVIKRANQKVA